jgi:hypothetical protein
VTTDVRSSSNWLNLAFDTLQFGADAVAVIVLRSLRVAGGGRAARAELARMVSEKVDAHTAFGAALLGGRAGSNPEALASAMIAHYGPRVRANRRRLSAR